MNKFCFVFAVAALSACSNPPPPPLPPPPDGTGVQLQMISSLTPAQETERCKFFTVPPEGMWVNHASVRYSPGSHHVLLFTTSYTTIPTVDRNGNTVDTSGIFDCAEGAPGSWNVDGVAGGAQSSDAPDVITLPPGVAVKLPGNSILIMNTHYLNASPREIETDARINLYTIPSETVTSEAGVLFFYNPFIRVPAMSKSSARMSCPVRSEVTLFNGQSHMHRRGVGYVANIVDEKGAKLEELYRANDWENIYVKEFAPGKKLVPGTSIDYRCEYENTESRAIMQGLTTKDEMCMFVGAYYPRDRALEICSKTPEFSGASSAATFIGHGDANCLETLLCAQSAKPFFMDQGESLFGCVVSSCEQVATQMSKYLHCQSSQGDGACTEKCKGGRTAECSSCVTTACQPAFDACAAARCE